MRTKRVEYDKGLYVKDNALVKEINIKAKEFVTSILDGVGEDYFIPDLESLVMTAIFTEISYKELVECATLDNKEE